jgi:6-phosphofructokinase 1
MYRSDREILTVEVMLRAYNAVIRAVLHGYCGIWNEVQCIEDSFEGILGERKDNRSLRPKALSGILPRGGTILGSRNRGHTS